MYRSWALLVLLALSGCEFYFGGDDGDPCENLDYGTGGAPPYPNNSLRDPTTGQCADYGYQTPCDDACGRPCPDVEVEYPDYGSCHSVCEGLPEAACIQTAGCFVAYVDYVPNDNKKDFFGCWQTPPSGPIHGTCTGNNAQECSRHDDCSAVYTDSNSTLQFEQCVPESGAGCNCQQGYHCEYNCANSTCDAVCVEDLTCAAVDCGPGYVCSEVCEVDQNGVSMCHPTCVADQACEALATEDVCKARGDCTPVYDGQNCTCTLSGCTCEVLTYERCQTL